ncbi:hypothetical protein BZG36_03948 [Bifiguratus adelaidae]|uniref:Endocytosis protein 3 n=1 Tax=Bifiguratus adelaidae TaxID=1938954 RepID=A0A261XZY0_9FUNG|nr:hypothetical protein BZG36_03948 [Bifiguratus adelaidae]
MSITQEEIGKYAEIFQAQNPVNGYINGRDLSDIDSDGQLDFDEFCIAMHLTYGTLDGVFPELPNALPQYVIPSSKAHLVRSQQVQVQPTGYGGQQGYVQPQEFNWGISSLDLQTYENVFNRYNQNPGGKIRFVDMEEFYATLPISREELSAAWSLVDVNHAHALSRDQAVVYLHILNQRSQGRPMPTELPSDLQKAFAGQYSANLGDRPGQNTNSRKGTNASAALADSYVNRLGVASTTLSSKGSVQAAPKVDEEQELRRQLSELQQKVADAQREALSRPKQTDENTLKSEFQALYDYKLKQLTESGDMENRVARQDRDLNRVRGILRDLQERMEDVRKQKREVEQILEDREFELQKVQREIDAEKA